jgi:hypothetical protein
VHNVHGLETDVARRLTNFADVRLFYYYLLVKEQGGSNALASGSAAPCTGKVDRSRFIQPRPTAYPAKSRQTSGESSLRKLCEVSRSA